MYCFGVVESKIFQCKVENLRIRKNSGTLSRPFGAYRPLPELFRFFKMFMSPEGVREEARIFSTFLNFQLYIEIFLIQLQQNSLTVVFS